MAMDFRIRWSGQVSGSAWPCRLTREQLKITNRLIIGRIFSVHSFIWAFQSSKWPPNFSGQSSLRYRNILTLRHSLVWICLLKSVWIPREPPPTIWCKPAPHKWGSGIKFGIPEVSHYIKWISVYNNNYIFVRKYFITEILSRNEMNGDDLKWEINDKVASPIYSSSCKCNFLDWFPPLPPYSHLGWTSS